MSVFRRIYTTLSSTVKRLALGVAPSPVFSSTELDYPVLKPLKDIYSRIVNISNKYDLYRMFVECDPELYGALNRIALMVRAAYKGIGVRIGHKLDEKEQRLLRYCAEFEQKYDLRSLFYSVAFHLLRDGDDIYYIDMNRGLKELQPLPIHALTILESTDQIDDISAQIFQANYYILNEGYGSEVYGPIEQKIFPKEKILHFSLNNRAEVVYDIRGRYTFGIWSISPLEALRSQLLWKLVLRINDIILRHRLVPRMHHKLDLSAYDPTRFSGETLEARISAAKEAAKSELEDYKSAIATPLKHVDQDFITGKNTEISYVEPRHITYVDPNPLLDQINKSIFAATGAHEASVTGRGRSTYASELVVASYTLLSAEALADIIKMKVLQLVRRHIRSKYPKEGFTEEDLNKIDIRFQFMLGLEKSEAVRRAAVISAMGIATIDELRDEVGLFEPLSEEDKALLVDIRRQGRVGEYTRTLSDIIAQYIRREAPSEAPKTPESKEQQRETV